MDTDVPTMPSASKLQLAAACGYPWTGQTPWPEDTMGEAALVGTAVHAIAAAIINGDPPLSASEAAGEQGLSDSSVVEGYRIHVHAQEILNAHLSARAEVAYALDIESGEVRELGVDIGRDYNITDTEVPGTVDVVWSEYDEVAARLVGVVRDWKTGDPWNVSPANKNLQLRFLAYCVAKTMDVDAVRVELAFVDDEGNLWLDTHEYDQFDLMLEIDELRELVRALPHCEPTPNLHCTSKYCPIRHVCPASVEALSEIITKAEELSEPPAYPLAIPDATAIESAEHAAWLYHRMRVVESATENIRKALEDWVVTHHPIEVEGRVWGPCDDSRETIDASNPSAIAAVLAEHTENTDAIIATIKSTLTKTDLEEVLGKKGARKVAKVLRSPEFDSAIAAVLAEHTENADAIIANIRSTLTKTDLEKALGKKGAKEVVDVLRGAGFVRTSTYPKFREYTPKVHQ